MFTLKVDDEITIQVLHPDHTEEIFNTIESNRSRLRPWIDPSALPETMQATRKYAIECWFNSLEDKLEMAFRYQDYLAELGGFYEATNNLETGMWYRGKLAGNISLLWESYESSTVEIGYWLSQEYEGRGIVTKCAAALMDLGVKSSLGIECFVIGSAAENRRSRAVAERLGYRLLRIIPRGERVGRFFYDRAVYQMFAVEWRRRRGTVK